MLVVDRKSRLTGTPFEVGSSSTFTASAAGEFFLGVNDNNFGDNVGSWTATITVSSPDFINLSAACVNGLQVDINGGAGTSSGAIITSISWTWGDGTSTPSGFFPQSHQYSSLGTYTIQVTAHYNDGSSASSAQSLSVGPGILTNCVALTITAGQYGSVSYQASVGSATISAGSLVTLHLDFADDLLLTANADAGFSYSSWSPSAGITGPGGGAVNTTSPSIDIVVTGSSNIAANFVLSTLAPPTPTTTPPLSSFPTVPQLFTSQAASFLTPFGSQTSSNAQDWLTTSSIQTNVSTTTNFLSLPQNVKQGFGNLATGASLVSTSLGLAGTLIDPGDPEGVLLTATGLALGTPEAQSQLNPIQLDTDQLALDGASIALSCVEAGVTSGYVPNFDAGCALSIGSGVADVTSIIATAVQSDPPDPNYNKVFLPQPIVSFPAPITGVSQDLQTKTWAAVNALDQGTMWLNAVRVTANRYGTALANKDAAAAGMQYMAFLNYFGLYLNAAGTTSMDLTELANLLSAQGIGTDRVTREQILDGLSLLATQGTSSPFINQFFTSLGFTTAQIQTMIQQAKANPPSPPSKTPVQGLETLARGFATPGVHMVLTLRSFTLDTSTDMYSATVSITNTGAATANNVTVTAAELHGTPVSTALPLNLGNLSYAGSATITLTFPSRKPIDGDDSLLTITETYAGGTAKEVLRVELPCRRDNDRDGDHQDDHN